MDEQRATTATWLALMTGVAIGLGMWSGSKNLFGVQEAWDLISYYFAFLFIGGVIGGLIFRKNYLTLYLGTVFGQLVSIFHLRFSVEDEGMDFFWPLGFFFLLLFSSITYFSAWAAAMVTRLFLGERKPPS